jgi:hypothetical protein
MYVSTTDNVALSRWALPPYDTNGTLVDMFESSDPSFLIGGRALPPVFRIGSLVEAPGVRKHSTTTRWHECLPWLDG